MDRITIKPYGKEKKAFKNEVNVKKKMLGDAGGVHKISTSTLGYDEKDFKIHQVKS